MALTLQRCSLANASTCRHQTRPASAHAFSSRRQHRQRLTIVRVADITSVAGFEEEVLKADVPVLVDFWAPWCGPCRLMHPLMTWAEKEHNGALKVVKIEHGPNPDLIEKYKVYGLPTLIVFKDGEIVPGSHREGAVGKAQLAEYLKTYAPSTVPAQ
eukprot:jgi/Chrzof1/10220/Cz04g33030.t1